MTGVSALDDFLDKLDSKPVPLAAPSTPNARLPRPRPRLFDEIDRIAPAAGSGPSPSVAAPSSPGGPQAAPSMGQSVSQAIDALLPAVAPAAAGEAPPSQSASPLLVQDQGYWDGVKENYRILTHGVARGFNQAQAGGAAFRGALPDWLADPDKAAADFTEQSRQAATYGYEPSEVTSAKSFNEADGFLAKMGSLIKNPAIAGTVMAESFGQAPMSIVPGIVGGQAAGLPGAAVGTAFGSGLTEYTAAISTFLHEKKGVDITDEEQVAAAFANTEVMREARDWAEKRGVAVGAFDGLTAFIGGPIVSGMARKLGRGIPDVAGKTPTMTSKAAGASTGMAVGMTGGVGGEAAASLATEGTVKMGDLILEAVGEVPTGAAELAVSTIYSGGMGSRGRQAAPTDEDIRRAGGVVEPPPPRVVSTEEAEAEGRTLYGFDTGEESVEVGTYEEAEKKAAETGVRKGRLIAVRPEETTVEEVSGSPSPVGRYDNWQAQIDELDARGAPDIDYRRILSTGSKIDPKKGETWRSKVMSFIELERRRQADPGPTAPKSDASTEDWEKYRADKAAWIQRIKTGAVSGAPQPQKNTAKVTTFRGDRSQLGVDFRQIDYLGLQVGQAKHPSRVEARDQFNPHMRKGLGSTQDIDGRKLTPGTLIPRTSGVRSFIQSYGEQSFGELAAKTETSEELVEQALSAIRSDDGVALAQLTTNLLNGTMKLVSDPRLMTHGAIVADSAKAADEVKRAIVEVKGSSKVVAGDRTNYLRQTAERFRRADGQPGSAILVDQDGEFDKVTQDQRRGLAAGVAVIEALIKRWKLPFDVQIVPFSARSANGLLSANESDMGYFIPIDDTAKGRQTSTIGIRVDPQMDGQTIYRVLAHEFGHYVSATGFFQQSPEIRTRIMAAYRRFLLTTTAGSVDEASNRILSGTQGKYGNSSTYFWSFEEWFAEQIARWALTNRRPLGFVAKHVKPIARKLLEAMKHFANLDPYNQMRPEPEIEAWLKSTLDGTVKAEWATQIQKWHDDETRTANENANRGNDNGPMSPMTPQSVGMRDVVAKLGEDAIQRQALEMGVAMPSLPAIFSQVDRFNWYYKWRLSLPQLAEINPHIEELQRYRELVQLMQVEQSDIMTAAHSRLIEWRKLGSAQAEALGKLLFDLTQLNYLTPAERAAGVVRQPTPAEFAALVRQHKLSQQAVGVYGSIRQDFEKSLQRYVDQLMQAAQGITNLGAQLQRITDIQKMQRDLLKRPYFPMTRYGKYTLTVRDGKRLEHFETFESKRQQEVAYKRSRGKWPKGSGFNVQMGVLSEEARGFLGVPPQMLDMIASTLKLSPAQQEALEQVKFELAPSQSFKKRFLHRDEISGWSEDAQRNYAHYMFHHAKHHVRTKYAGPLREMIDAVKRSKNLRGDDARKIGGIANFMNHHMEEILNPKADLAALRSAAAVFHLGFSPAAALLNLTQLTFATTPFLSSKFGDFKTILAMRKATMAVSNLYRKKSIATMQQSELRAVSQAIEEGFLDESQAAELAALAEGNTMLASVPGTDIRKKWNTISSYAMMMFSGTERWNRRVTFRAAWNLAMDNPNTPWLRDLGTKHQMQLQRLLSSGWSQREAIAFLAGKDTVLSTQFEYARYARPRFMQGRKGAIFMFFMFTQNMAFMLGHNWRGVLPRYLLTMMFLGGMMGLPGAEDAEEIIKAVAGRFGKDFDIEREARKLIVEVVGDPYVADLALRGISRDSLNLGILHDIAGVTDLPQVDMSRQISMGRILPINPAFLIGSPGISQERAFRKGVEDNAGAAFGIGFALHKALTDADTPWGDPKLWIPAVPRALKGPMKSYQAFINGGVQDRGLPPQTIAPFDYQDPAQAGELVAMALGLQSTRVSRGWDQTIANIEQKNFWMARRGLVMDQFTRALLDPKLGNFDEATRAWQRFNNEVISIDPTMVIKKDSVRQSIRTRLEGSTRQSVTGSRTRMGTGISLENQRLYPGAIDVRPLKNLEKASSPGS